MTRPTSVDPLAALREEIRRAGKMARRLRERQFLRRLADLPVTERPWVLQPLRGESTGDTQRLVAFLDGELARATELTPTGTPEGRGQR